MSTRKRREQLDNDFFDDDEAAGGLGELNIQDVDQIGFGGLSMPVARKDDETGVVKLGAFHISPKGLQINTRITQTEWWAFFDGIRQIENAIQFVIGDLAAYGTSEFQITYEEIAEKTGYKKETVENYASVARNVPQEIRVPELSFNHHYHVASLDSRDEKERWLKYAKELNLSVRDLQHAIASDNPQYILEIHEEKESPVKKARLKGIRERDKTLKKAKKRQTRREWLKYAREQAQEWEALVEQIKNLD